MSDRPGRGMERVTPMRGNSVSIRDIMILVLGAACVLAMGRHDPRVWLVGIYPAALLAAVIGLLCGQSRSKVLAGLVLSSFPILGLARFAFVALDADRHFYGLLTGTILVAATLGAWFCRGELRTFAWAFAFSGSVSLGYHANYVLGRDWRTRPPVFFIVLNPYYSFLFGDPNNFGPRYPSTKFYIADEIVFLFIGTCVLSLFTGLWGGILATWLRSKTRVDTAPARLSTQVES